MTHLAWILLALLAVSVFLTARAWSTSARANRRMATLADSVERLKLENDRRAELEQDRRLMRLFLREYPLFMRDLHGSKKSREIAPAIIGFIERIFEPTGAVVLFRRLPARSDPDQQHQVVSAASCGTGLRPGTVLRPGVGILDSAFESGRTLDQRELEAAHLDGATAHGFQPDLASPMWIDGKILGVVALSNPTRNLSVARYLLELIAQTGALALANSRALHRIRSAADIDALTGILNRGAMTYLLEQAVESAVAERTPLSIFLFDIDHFKNYNDVNGHLAGDELLRVLPRLVSEHLRSDDAFGRYGGEEFLLLLTQRAPDEALVVAEKIRGLIEEQDFPFAERQPLGHVTISGGVSTLPDHANSAEDLLRTADEALYAAKEAGRNRVFCAHDRRAGAVETHGGDDAGQVAAGKDDLKRIRGIGKVYEQKLNELGITSYRQIADLDWQLMNEVAGHLNTFPERIVRDQWLKQARALCARRDEPEAPDQSAAVL